MSSRVIPIVLSLGAAIATPAGSAKAADTKDVRVVNTPGEGIPVTATGPVALVPGTQVGVAGAVSLAPGTQVGVTGTVALAPGAAVGVSGAVTLAPGTQVEVANTPANPLHVVAAAEVRQVFAASVFLEWPEGATNRFATIAIPAGKRLVVESLSAVVSGNADQEIIFRARGTLANLHFIQVHFKGEESKFDFGTHARGYSFAERVQLYHDSSDFDFQVGGIRQNGLGTASGTISVSGYLVDLPSLP
jgi:hypothetical protein